MARVVMQNVVKRYGTRGEVLAVNNLNLECKDQEFFCLLGPSGCGKSSTMRMIAGLENITSGNILIGDRIVNRLPPFERGVAMVFENYALYPHLTARENITLSLEVHGMSHAEIRRQVDMAVRILQIDDILDRKPDQLGGGQKQRVAIARAIVRDPDVFIMDEPISHIDARLRTHVRGELKKLHRELGTTTLYVTHNQFEAMTMADRVAVMNEGEIQQVGTPSELFDHPANLFVAGFIGEPAMNFLEGELTRMPDGSATVRAADALVPVSRSLEAGVVSRRVVCGVRPEDLVFTSGPNGGLAVQIILVEPIGDESVVTVRMGGSALKVLVGAGFNIPQSGAVSLRVPPERVHVFDTATGRALQ
jgi:multiple sugar transport system ATP-binding protein